MSRRTQDIVANLIKSVVAMNEAEFSDQLDVLFELYPVRTVLIDYISTTMCEIGDLWAKGDLMVMVEHFASNIVIAKLKAMLHEQNAVPCKGPTFLVACPQNEQHEIGALMIAILLSANGWKVIYLGQNTPTSEIIYAIDHLPIHTVALSASHEGSLEELITIGAHIKSKTGRKPEYLVGGLLFLHDKHLINKIPAASTKNFLDMINLRPPNHPGMQDAMVKEAMDSTYARLREASLRIKSASSALRKSPEAAENNVP